MTSTRALQKTLPRIAPNRARHRNALDGLVRYKFNIFSLASLDVTELHRLEDNINSGEFSTKRSKLAPQPDFSSRSLKDVYDYHIRIRDEDDTVHPLYFIVADQKDALAHGVIVVLLDAGQDEPDRVGVGRCGVDMADSWGANIDIGNQDWFDLKEEEADQWNGDDPYADDDDDDANVDDPNREDRDSGEARSQAVASGHPTVATDTHSMKFGWYSLVQKAVPINSMLEPNWLDLGRGESRFQMLGNFYSSSDPWSEIRAAHPRQCHIRPAIHRTLILVAQQEDANQAGAVAIVRLKWDGDTSNVEEASPPMKPEIEVLRRVKAEEALREINVVAEELRNSGT